MNKDYRTNKGFGMVEILITLGVLAVGILGVAAFQGNVGKQSQDNKSRSEAYAIAQSRIEEMRNYTDTAASPAEFDALYANTGGFVNSTSVTGVTATFTRTESITTTGEQKNIVVAVAWSSADAQANNISLSTRLGFVSPRTIGDTVRESAPPLVNAPTGRARLGEGELPAGAATTANGDGTSLYQDGGEDLMLVFDDQIVLTLANACQTEDGECIDFVKIKGKIYIDTSSQGNLNPGEVFVVASDAAFCARYYVSGGQAHTVTNNTVTALTTPSGDYNYFDYTCYIGGGWHGNVGILLAGGIAQSDKICQGDPVSVEPWEAPIIAARRAYRGMLYKQNNANASGKEEMSDGDGGTLIRYYSHGIADSVELPVPDTEQSGHDFVIGSMQANQTAGANCISQGVMTRGDSNVDGATGGLFAGIPRDFVCLNPDYLDGYDVGIYGHESHCPFDPTNPPSSRHVVSGSISVTAPMTAANIALVASVNALTSDGIGNCLVGTFAHNGTNFVGSYECDVFDWGNGWNGFVRVTYDASGMACSPNQISFANISNNTSGNNFNNCSPGSFAVISGTVSTSNANNRYLTSATLSDDGVCSVEPGGLAYSCVTGAIDGTWNGTITFGYSGGVLCATSNGVVTFNGIAPGYTTVNLNIRNNAGQCP